MAVEASRHPSPAMEVHNPAVGARIRGQQPFSPDAVRNYRPGLDVEEWRAGFNVAVAVNAVAHGLNWIRALRRRHRRREVSECALDVRPACFKN